MVIDHKINQDKPDIKGMIKTQEDLIAAKAFEDGTKAGLEIAIKQLERIRDSFSISDVLEEAKR